VNNPEVDLDAKEILGKGIMSVKKILYNHATPYETHIESTGSAEEDWIRYYQQSEQTDTFMIIEASMRQGRPFVGGLTVQALPGEEGAANVFTLQTRAQFGEIPPLSVASQEHGMLGAVAAAFAIPIEELDNLEKNAAYKHVDYFCRCTKEGFLGHMASLPQNELHELAEEGGAELKCHYCNDAHQISADDIRTLIATVQR